jgi:hypothetical protein
VRFPIIDCLEDFLRWRHYFDSVEKNRPDRDYLRKYLSSVSDGDLVITLNLESATERSLANLVKWSPLVRYRRRADEESEVGRSDANFTVFQDSILCPSDPKFAR